MRLADTIAVRIGGESIPLVPSLRHAFVLERRPGSFARLVHDLLDGSLTATRDILALHDPRPDLAQAILQSGLASFQEPLVRFVLACAGLDPDREPKEAGKGKTVAFADHLANLYRLGTGWLGWTPADTLDATPAEITAAYEGRLDMLKAIFGSGEEKPEPEADMPLDEKVRTALGSFGTTIVKRRKTP